MHTVQGDLPPMWGPQSEAIGAGVVSLLQRDPSIYLPVCLPISLSTYLSIYLPISLPTHLPTYLCPLRRPGPHSARRPAPHVGSPERGHRGGSGQPPAA